MANRVGTEIAGCRIESLLARGGMGEVYLAEQASPRRNGRLGLWKQRAASIRSAWEAGRRGSP